MSKIPVANQIDDEEDWLMDFDIDWYKSFLKRKGITVPSFDRFDPRAIPWQEQLMYDIDDMEVMNNYEEVQTIICSGAVGSSKSALGSFLTLRHCIQNDGAKACMGRIDTKRLKQSQVPMLLSMMPSNWDTDDYDFHKTDLKLNLPSDYNSYVESISWSDGDYDRFKSRDWSFFHLEEASETDDRKIYDYIIQRTGRNQNFAEKIILLTTNPDEPEHWINKDLILTAGWVDGVRQEGKDLNYNIHVYYSVTKDNPFLSPGYYSQLERTYDELGKQRFLMGRWVSMYGVGVYRSYSDKNYIRKPYKINESLPIWVSLDFNVADGKPMSTVIAQVTSKGQANKQYHFFKEVIEQGNTDTMMQALFASPISEEDPRLLLHQPYHFIFTGDPAGHGRAASSNGWNNFSLIEALLNEHYWIDNGAVMKISFEFRAQKNVFALEPSQNAMNALMKNAKDEVNLFVYEDCPTLNEGFKLTRMKNKSKTQEDDSKSYQHCTTSARYLVMNDQRGENTVTVIRR